MHIFIYLRKRPRSLAFLTWSQILFFFSRTLSPALAWFVLYPPDGSDLLERWPVRIVRCVLFGSKHEQVRGNPYTWGVLLVFGLQEYPSATWNWGMASVLSLFCSSETLHKRRASFPSGIRGYRECALGLGVGRRGLDLIIACWIIKKYLDWEVEARARPCHCFVRPLFHLVSKVTLERVPLFERSSRRFRPRSWLTSSEMKFLMHLITWIKDISLLWGAWMVKWLSLLKRQFAFGFEFSLSKLMNSCLWSKCQYF